jgi:uncharacterized protein YjiS (DUF1127 family)
MTTIVQTATASFFSTAFEAVITWVRDARVRRAQRIALVALMDMDAYRLDDLGLNVQDVVDALNAPPPANRVLDSRRTARAATWSPASPSFTA